MRTHRIHTFQPLEPEQYIVLKDAEAHYLARVLRASTGQSVLLFNGDSHDYVADIVAVDRRQVKLEIRARIPALSESWLRITVVQAISRGERMDLTLQKCTELGAAAFQPIISERTEVKLRPEKVAKRMAHWRSVMISACEQSGRAVVPELAEPVSYTTWLQRPANGVRCMLSPAAEQPLTMVEPGNRLELLVGPEGGFSEAELAAARLAAVREASIGPRVLRTETAGPAALAILQAAYGDLGGSVSRPVG